MSKINVLPKEISELIAAGEVIERPCSVIKEVVENAIDAGAKHITVEIKNGGTTFMRIVDDGCGMAPEEVTTAFLRHATSKITEKADLDQIFTLGFRGEALASIAAVAKVTVLTKRREDAYGTSYTISGGVSQTPEQAGCPDGTTLLIRDLFFNVPVRQKFMKKDVAEGNAVSQIVQKIALSHPEIAFRMIRDNRVEFHTDGSGDLYTAIYAVLGKEVAYDMIPVDYEVGMYAVHGYVGKPLYSRSNRTYQNFFINGRYVRSRQCSVALENAYQNLIMTGKFPTCVLMLQVPPSQVDVNIHPAKAEVRFSQEKAVMESIFFAVKNALMQNGLIYEFQMEKVPQKDWEADPVPQADYVQPTLPTQASSEIASPSSAASAVVSESSASASVSSPQRAETPSPLAAVRLDTTTQIRALPEEPEQIQTAPRSEKISSDTLSGYHFLNASSFQAKAAPVSSVSEKENQGEEPLPPKKVRVLGEVFQNYILAELDGEEKLLIFDKHAAHERVIFERLQSGATKQTSQMLLKPGETVLSMEEFTAVQENLERLESMGFSFDCSTPPTLQTLAVPSFVLELNIDEVISEIAHNLALGKADPQAHRFQDMLHSIACKSAIRSGDHTSLLELQKLAQEVWDNEAIRHCPHGRPVMFVIRKYDLEKQFRRT